MEGFAGDFLKDVLGAQNLFCQRMTLTAYKLLSDPRYDLGIGMIKQLFDSQGESDFQQVSSKGLSKHDSFDKRPFVSSSIPPLISTELVLTTGNL